MARKLFAVAVAGLLILGTSAAWVTFTLSASKPPDPSRIAWTAAAVAGAVCLVGAVVTHWLPEPPEELPE